MGGSSSCQQALFRPFLSRPVFLCASLTAKEKQVQESLVWVHAVPRLHLQLTNATKSPKVPSDKGENLEPKLNSPELAFL